MGIIDVSAATEYLRAQKSAFREKKEREALGLSPYPVVLDEECPEVSRLNSVSLPLQDIRAKRIVGIKTKGRITAFTASFLPLLEADTEFAAKWIALCEAHNSETGIRDPIECYEYLGDYYVTEGNKRVSVLKYYGAVRIPAHVRRILPARDSTDPRITAYYESLDFSKDSGVSDISFHRPGDAAKLLAALDKKTGEEWTEQEQQTFISFYRTFLEAFSSFGEKEEAIRPEDALLLLLKVSSYRDLSGMSSQEISKQLTALWDDVKVSADPETLSVSTQPSEERKSAISKLISGVPRHLNTAFICQRDEETSPWTRGHIEGAKEMAEALKDAVSVKIYCHADGPENEESVIDEAVRNGAELVFTTTPLLLTATLKAAIKYPKVRFYNCSACQPLSSVKSYYCRTYEGKFITGLIAGALANNDLVGYIGSYPILGVPASINAFALGARMTNPRAKVLLEWTCTEVDCVAKLRERGAEVISNRDIPVPDANYMKDGYYGVFQIENGEPVPVASPVWVWGKLYENIARSILDGNAEQKEQPVNYWWGMDSGAIDVTMADLVPEGVKKLADTLSDMLREGSFDIFSQRLTAQDGTLISDGEHSLSTTDILKMDKLSDIVEGHIPEFEEVFPMSRALVRELGVHRDRIPPETGETT